MAPVEATQQPEQTAAAAGRKRPAVSQDAGNGTKRLNPYQQFVKMWMEENRRPESATQQDHMKSAVSAWREHKEKTKPEKYDV